MYYDSCSTISSRPHSPIVVLADPVHELMPAHDRCQAGPLEEGGRLVLAPDDARAAGGGAVAGVGAGVTPQEVGHWALDSNKKSSNQGETH